MRSLRRIFTAVVALACLPFIAPAPAVAAAPTRIEKIPYQAGDGSVISFYTNLGAGMTRMVIPGGPERYVSLKVEDASGQPVAAEIVQADRVAEFCGSTEHPIRIQPDFDLTVTLFTGRCPDASPSVATTGTVVATFLRSVPDPRVQSAGYSPYQGATGLNTEMGYLAAEITFPAGPERYVSVVITDQSGAAVPAQITQADVVTTFCGETPKPVRITPNYAVVVRIFTGPCPPAGQQAPVGTATRGTVEATFSENR